MSKLGDEPAYPFTPNQQMQLADGTWDQDTDFGEPGMTKRELFAAMAMQGFCANSDIDDGIGSEDLAVYSLKNADALLKELVKEQP